MTATEIRPAGPALEAELPGEDDALLDVAVVGIACRFPGADGPDAFWDLVRDGRSAIRRFDRTALIEAGVPAETLANPNHVAAGGVIDDGEDFDAEFFGYTPGEAALIDPQQRMFLEGAWRALEDAGHDPRTFPGDIAVMAGQTHSTHLPHDTSQLLTNPMDVFAQMTSNEKDFLPTRVSHKLGLTGPSINVQSACSTSLVAIHLATQSLLDGECDMALAGGVSWTALRPRGYLYQPGGIMSAEGTCRPFDREASGFVPGDGLGIVVLRRLTDALATGDRIYAVLKGSAVTNDGSDKVGYTAPGLVGQQRAVVRALRSADVHPDTIGYVEAHGTATRLGDPVEVAALTRAYRALGSGGNGGCVIGSVKANIGHTDVAAGVAGFIKAVLAVHHGYLPPSSYLDRVNDEITLDDGPFRFESSGAPWSETGTPRRAAVSSFGIGGTNAHVIVEQPPAHHRARSGRAAHLVTLSAHNDAALTASAAAAAEALDGRVPLDVADAARSWGEWDGMRHRLAVVATDATGAVEALRRFPGGGDLGTGIADRPPDATAFLFPGGGAHHAGMGRGLYRHEPAFRRSADVSLRHLADVAGVDLRDRVRAAMYGADAVTVPSTPDPLADPRVGLPALFVTEVATCALLAAHGVRPTVLLGHSLGEYTAAYIAGVFSLTDALAVVVERGEILATIAAGAMLSVPAAEDVVRARLTPDLSLAAVNGPELCTAAGPSGAIAQLREDLAADAIAAHPLPIATAAHSLLVEPALPRFREFLSRLTLHSPSLPVISNVTGRSIGDEMSDPEYWVRHLRSTVRFDDGLSNLPGRRAAVIEVGPGTSLSTVAKARPGVAFGPVVNTLRHPRDPSPDTEVFLRALGQLWVAGVEVDRTAGYEGEIRNRVPGVRHPMSRRRCAVDRGPTVPLAPQATPLAGASSARAVLYGSAWRRRVPVPETAGPCGDGRDRHWLVLTEGGPLTDAVVAALAERGVTPLIATADGGHDVQGADGGHWFDPLDRSHYARILGGIPAGGPVRVVDLLPTGRSGLPGRVGGPLGTGIGSLLGLAHAAVTIRDRDLELCIVTCGAFGVTGGEELNPDAACVAGAGLALPAELEGVRIRHVDLDPAEAGSAPHRAATLLLAETVADPVSDPVVAHRGGHRWVRCFDELGGTTGPSPLRDGGTYLVTGGGGGVGRAVADALVARYRANLVLVGRTMTDAEPSGGASRVLHRCGDVTDRARMAAILREARERFGGVDGVVHAAGTPGGGTTGMIDEDTVRAGLVAKVDGTRSLFAALGEAGVAPDFVALFSSLSALAGTAGTSTYSAANAFLDTFALYASHELGIPTVSLGWDRWQGVGMAREVERLHRARTSCDPEPALQPDVAIDAFVGALAHLGVGQVAISTRHPDDLLVGGAGVPPAPPGDVGSSEPATSTRPALSTDHVAPRTDDEQAVVLIWEETLGITGLGVQDNFFELGGQSLTAMRIVQRVNDRFGCELSAPMLFTAPSVAGLLDLANAPQPSTDPLEA